VFSNLALFVLLLAFLIYMVIMKGSTVTFQFIGFMMALGNTYGVLLIIVLMGHGLVALPQRLWQIGNAEAELVQQYLLVIEKASFFSYLVEYLL
jgi:hypothetical protein